MLPMFPLIRLLGMCSSVLLTAPVAPAILLRPPTVHAVPSSAPRFLWQAKLPAHETITLGPSATGRLVVFSTPPKPRNHGNQTSLPLTATAFNLLNGKQLWQTRIAGLSGGTAADERGWYAAIPLPLPTENPFQIKPTDFRAELTAFDWTSGREIWHKPCAYDARPIALDGMILYNGQDLNLIALDAATGQERWQRDRRDIRGLFAVNDLLYAYDESLDNYGPDHDPPGEYLNALDPATGHVVQRIRFYPQFWPLAGLGALEWLPQTKLLVGANELFSVGTQHVELRALDATGKLIWNRLHTGRFQVIAGVLICENWRPLPNRHPDYDVPDGVVALDPATGHELWRSQKRNYDRINAWNHLLVVCNTDMLLGIDPGTDKIVWQLALTRLPLGNNPHKTRPQRDDSAVTSDCSVRAYGQYLAIAKNSTARQNPIIGIYVAPNASL